MTTSVDQTLTAVAAELERKSNAVASKAKRLLQANGLASPGPEGSPDSGPKNMDAAEGLSMMRKAMAALVSLCNDSASQIKKAAAEVTTAIAVAGTTAAHTEPAPAAAASSTSPANEDVEAKLKVALAEGALLRADLETLRDASLQLQQANEALKAQIAEHTVSQATTETKHQAEVEAVEAKYQAEVQAVVAEREATRENFELTIAQLHRDVDAANKNTEDVANDAREASTKFEQTHSRLEASLADRQRTVDALREDVRQLESTRDDLNLKVDEAERQANGASLAQRKAEARADALERKLTALESIRVALEKTIRAHEDKAAAARRDQEAVGRQHRGQLEALHSELAALRARLMDDHLRSHVATQQKEIDELRMALLDAKAASKKSPPAPIVLKTCDGTCEWAARFTEAKELLGGLRQGHAAEVDRLQFRVSQLEEAIACDAERGCLESAQQNVQIAQGPSYPTSHRTHNVGVQHNDGECARLRGCLLDMEALTEELKQRFDMVANDALQSRIESESALARMHAEYQDSLNNMAAQLKIAQYRASRAKECEAVLESARSESIAQQEAFDVQRTALEEAAARLDAWRTSVERKSLDLALEVEMLRAKNKALVREADRLRDDYDLKLHRAAMLYEGQTTALIHQHQLELTLREGSEPRAS